MVAFQNVNQLLARFEALGATRVFFKLLAENDNSKQQIYLGAKFEVLTFFPHGTIAAYPMLSEPNFKAPLEFYWIAPESVERAQGAQLILYPQYPEVRLSGFLAGTKTAPSKELQPIPKDHRKGADGRAMIFGITPAGKTFACLAAAGSDLAAALVEIARTNVQQSLFVELTLATSSATNKNIVLGALQEIHKAGAHQSMRLNKRGDRVPYKAKNGGGYTLEALLGIKPNGYAEPDFHGWEIKAHSTSRITLMTPEPTGGYYGVNGAKAFVEKYGRLTAKGEKYFTGTHTVDVSCATSGMTLSLRGFESATKAKFDVSGAVLLIDKYGEEAASWPFAQMLNHWNKKHAFAAYVPYTTTKAELPAYEYGVPVVLGEHTDFVKCLAAISTGAIQFDPGSKVIRPGTTSSTVKARSQFRINKKNLNQLYETLTPEWLS